MNNNTIATTDDNPQNADPPEEMKVPDTEEANVTKEGPMTTHGYHQKSSQLPRLMTKIAQ